MDKIRLILIDDDTLFTSLLADFFNQQPHATVVKTLNDGAALLSLLDATLDCDLILLDLRMPGLNGIETLKEIRAKQPLVRTVILSSFYRATYSGYMLKCGASAFLPKEVSPEELMHAVVQVHEHGHYFYNDQVEQLRAQVSPRSPRPSLDKTQQLTEREIEILQLLCQQLTAKEIAEKLFITPRTVEGHKNNLMLKTGAKNLAGLVVFAFQNRIVDPGEMFMK